jgi:hypothetical protein
VRDYYACACLLTKCLICPVQNVGLRNEVGDGKDNLTSLLHKTCPKIVREAFEALSITCLNILKYMCMLHGS